MALEAKLLQILRLDVKEQSAPLCKLIDEVTASASIPGLRALSQKILSEDVHFLVTKSALLHMAQAIKTLPEDVFYEIAVFLVSQIKAHPSAQSYDESDYILRDALFFHCIGSEEYTEGAQFLAGTNLDSTSRVFTDLEKVDIYIKCAGKTYSEMWDQC